MAEFEPRIQNKPGIGTQYDDGSMIGSVIVRDDGLVITEWESLDPGKGNSVRALKWLRERFSVIVALGVGEIDDGVGDIATGYWEHMRSKGLVDVLILDDGTVLEPGWQTETGGPKP